MQVSEIFFSIQGESSRAGLPCVFVRLTGCNLRCQWCDTEYAFYGGERLGVEQVADRIRQFPARLLEITGGEPMLQEKEVLALIALLPSEWTVMIETSGERDLGRLPERVVKIMDVKCPGSGEAGRFHAPNLKTITPRDEIKFVLTGREDYEYARDFIGRHRLAAITPHILLSPAFQKTAAGERGSRQCQLDPQNLAEWMLADGIPARLSLQIHKFIWDPAQRGV